MAAIELDAHGIGRGVAVARRERVVRFGREFAQIQREKIRVLLFDHELEVRRAHFRVFPEGVEKIERVLDLHIVWIAGKGALELASPLGHVAGTQEVLPQHCVRTPGLGVALHSLSCKGRRAHVEAVARHHLAERREELAVMRIACERASLGISETRAVVRHETRGCEYG